MKSDLRGLKVADEIFTIEKGYEPIKNIVLGDEFPIRTKNNCYTYEGLEFDSYKYPSAFIINPFNEERVVQVRDYPDQKWETRVLFKEKNGLFFCWRNAKTLEDAKDSIQPVRWKFMREIPKLSKEEISKKLGMSIEEIKEVIN